MQLKALVISGCPTTAADTYRVGNLCEELSFLGWEYAQSNFDDLFGAHRHLLEQLGDFHVVYSHRCPYSEEYRRVIERARDAGIPALYDIDDYVFDIAVMPHVKAIQHWGKEQRDHYLGDLLSYEKALKLHQYGVTPTAWLAARMKEKGLAKVFVLPNCLSAEMRVWGENASYDEIRRNESRDHISIGFFSGTKTHDADFLVAREGIRRVLRKNKRVRLILAGELEVSSHDCLPAEQTVRYPLVPMRDLYGLMVKADITIAPLEIDNPYCQAKSELKYFDAGIVGVPTVASATDAYCGAIKSWVNGFLARTDSEWAEYLQALVSDGTLRSRLGHAAKLDTYERYTTARAYPQLGEILAEVL